MPTYLEFEQPIAELEGKIEELRHLPNAGDLNIAEEVARLQQKADKLLRQIYGKLSPWQKTLVARHIERPHFSDYVAGLIEDSADLAGKLRQPPQEFLTLRLRQVAPRATVRVLDREPAWGAVELAIAAAHGGVDLPVYVV